MWVCFSDQDHELLDVELPIGGTLVGRSSASGIVLRSPSVSSRHALLVRDGDRVTVRDQGSTNGTFVNEERVFSETPITPDDVVRFGTRIVMRLQSAPSEASPWLLFDATGSVALRLGSGAQVPGTDVTLTVDDEGVHLTRPDGSEECVPLDCVFEAGGAQWQVSLPGTERETEPNTTDLLPYTLRVDLHGPHAVLLHRDREVPLRSAPAVALLHVLATQLRASQDQGESPWCSDEALRQAVWGRAWRSQNPNSLNVLVHRVRKRAVDAGLERSFIERRPGETRLRVQTVQLRQPAT